MTIEDENRAVALEVLGLVIGEEVALVPTGATGSGFQGKLLDLIVTAEGAPFAYVIEGHNAVRLTVFHANISMLYHVKPPTEVDLPQDVLDALEAAADVYEAELADSA